MKQHNKYRRVAIFLTLLTALFSVVYITIMRPDAAGAVLAGVFALLTTILSIGGF